MAGLGSIIKCVTDGSTQELLYLNDEDSEIQFDGAGSFYLRESPSGEAQAAYLYGYDPADHPVKEVTWYGSVRYCDWLSLQAGLHRAYEHSGDWSCNGGDPYGAEGYRLPTDAEWEFATQFEDERIYSWGDEDADCSRANFYDIDGSGEYCVGWTCALIHNEQVCGSNPHISSDSSIYSDLVRGVAALHISL